MQGLMEGGRWRASLLLLVGLEPGSLLSRERLLWPRGISLRLPLEPCRWLPLWLGVVSLGFTRWAQRPLESGLLRPIGLFEMRLVGREGYSTDGNDSVHGWLDPDLLTELFLFLLFVVVTQGPL